MGVRACAPIAERLIGSRAPARKAGRGGRAGHHSRSAPSPARSPTSPTRGGRGRTPAGDHRGRPRRRAARRLAWLERRPLHGRGGGHAGARAGQRTRGPAARPGRRGHRGPRDPHRAAPRRLCPSARSAYALVCLTSPNGARLLLRALARGGCDARGSPASRWRRSGPAPRRRSARRGIQADFVAERSVAEGLLEALGGEPRRGAARAGRPRRRGARHAARRAARARRRGRACWRSTTRLPSRSTSPSARAWRAPPT